MPSRFVEFRLKEGEMAAIPLDAIAYVWTAGRQVHVGIAHQGVFVSLAGTPLEARKLYDNLLRAMGIKDAPSWGKRSLMEAPGVWDFLRLERKEKV